MRRLAPKLALAASSLALALLGVEVLLRLRGYDPLGESLSGRARLVRESAWPGRGYELVPLASGEGWGARVEVNSHGFRGPEVDPAASGRVRVVALGDSVTFGNDLAYEDAWPARLESALREREPATDVLDLGLGGYDTTQEVATLEALGLAFAPSHVVVGFCVNDLGVVSMSMETAFGEEDRDDPVYVSRIAQWLRVAAVERAQRRELSERNREDAYARAFAAEIEPLERSLAPALAALRADVQRTPAAERELATRRIPARWYASESRLGRLQRAFGRLRGLADAHGFAVTVLLVPYLEDDPLIERGYRLVRALAEARGFAVVDPSDAFRAEGLAALRIRAEDPVHPNARGHALMAQALAETLATAAPSAPARPVD